MSTRSKWEEGSSTTIEELKEDETISWPNQQNIPLAEVRV